MVAIKKVRKQKYPFKTIEVGGTFELKKIDYPSMRASLNQHNKKFNRVELEVIDLNSAKMLATRIK